MKNKAFFIAIEGLEGAGKTTAMTSAKQWMTQHQLSFINTREPGATPFAEKLRDLLKSHAGEEPLYDMTELLLMYAARVQVVEYRIKPALAAGVWVLADRHDLSSQAYQGGGRQIDSKVMETLKQTTIGTFKPDLTIYLDICPKIGLQRAASRGSLDRIEMMDIAFFERVRQRYLELAAADDSIVVIDAQQPLEHVSSQIQSLLQHWYSR